MEMLLQGLQQLLVQKKLLTKEETYSYQDLAKKSSQRFIEYLVQNNVLSAKHIAAIQAKYFNLSLINLDDLIIEENITKLISDDLILKYNLLPLFFHDKQLCVAMDEPSQHKAIQDVKFHTGLEVIPFVVETTKLQERIKQLLYSNSHQSLEGYFNEFQDVILQQKQLNKEEVNIDAPIIKLVNLIIQQAIKKSASDIHFEPYADYYRIRFRQDGLLHDVFRPPKDFATKISARLKVMANLDLSERRVSQDGRFSFYLNGAQLIDCRISTCPTISGEKIVIRLLNSNPQTKLEIDSLLLNSRDKTCLHQALTSSQGLILVTGPTGSGKSITLYTALNYLNTGEVNILTIEDPVEIKLAGINQVQINSKIGLDFANTLRSFLRQDPDIIMIGEIRDLETAEIALKAAQTGHLVLSTLHTNSAAETLIRLLNIGIQAFYLINTIKLIIAQRLIRKLCENCKILRNDITPDVLKDLGYWKYASEKPTFYKATGCKNCTYGYQGRIALFEVMPISTEIAKIMLFPEKKLINIIQQAELEGMHTIKQAGFIYAEAGITSLEELSRVT